MYDLSEEDVVSGWFENPYWQRLSGMQWFEHEVPIHPSSMTRRRKRTGEAGADELLKATIDAGLKRKVQMGTLKGTKNGNEKCTTCEAITW
jgi:IS5 family transposase